MFKKTCKSVLCHVASPIIKLKQISGQSRNTGNVFSLIFHDVSRNEIDPFRQLLIQLKKEYGFLDPEDFIRFIKGEIKLSNDHFLLTFDDGFVSNYKIAKEILNPLQIKAIFFVPTGFIDAKTPEAQKLYIKRKFRIEKCVANFHDNEIKAMTLENLSELLDMGYTIGGHTKNHCRLSEINDDAFLREEIVSSGDRIEELLGVEVEHFAYPFGDIGSISRKAMEIAKSRYSYVYSGVRGANKFGIHPGAIRREALNISDGIKYNTFVANGGLSLYYRRARSRLDAIAS